MAIVPPPGVFDKLRNQTLSVISGSEIPQKEWCRVPNIDGEIVRQSIVPYMGQDDVSVPWIESTSRQTGLTARRYSFQFVCTNNDGKNELIHWTNDVEKIRVILDLRIIYIQLQAGVGNLLLAVQAELLASPVETDRLRDRGDSSDHLVIGKMRFT